MNQFVNIFSECGYSVLFKCKKAIRFSHSFVHRQPLFPLFSLIPLCHFTIKPLSASPSSFYLSLLFSLSLSSSLCRLHPSSIPLSFIAPVVLTMCEWGWMMGGRMHARGSYTSAWHIQTHFQRHTHTHTHQERWWMRAKGWGWGWVTPRDTWRARRRLHPI